MRLTILAVTALLFTPAAAQSQRHHRLPNKLGALGSLVVAMSVSKGGEASYSGCETCRTPIEAYAVDVRIPAGYELSRFEVTAGAASITAISPDGRRAVGEVVVTGVKQLGYHELGVVVTNARDPSDRRMGVVEFFVEAQTGRQCQPSPCATPAPYPRRGCQVVPACSYRRLRATGALQFGNATAAYAIGWPQVLSVNVGLPARLAGRYELAGEPAVRCTTGTARVLPELHNSRMALTHRLIVDTSPAAGKRIAGGRHQCTVELALRDKKSSRVITRAGTLRFVVGPDGEIEKLPDRCATRARSGRERVVCPR